MAVIAAAGCLTLGVLLTSTTSPPDGLWVGIYRYYWGVWLAITVALGVILVAVRYWQVRWSVLIILGLGYSGAVLSLSRVWGVPFGFHDVWTHLGYIRTGVFMFPTNPYPSLHILVKLLADLTGVSTVVVLAAIPILAAALFVCLLASVLRAMKIPTRTAQTAFLVGLPACCLGLTARPFTLAFPFLLWYLWMAIRPNTGRRAYRDLFAVLTVGILFLHPEVLVFAFFVLLALTSVRRGEGLIKRAGISLSPRLQPSRQSVVTPLAVMLPVLLAGWYLGVVLNIGPHLLGNVLIRLFEAGIETPTSAKVIGGTSILAQLLASPAAVVEALLRGGYLLTLTGGMAVVIVGGLYQGQVRLSTAIATVSIALLGAVFVIVDVVLHSTGLNLRRLFVTLPVLFVVGSAPVFKNRLDSDGRAWREVAVVVFAFVIILSGTIVVYPSELTGSTAAMPDSETVAAVGWLADHRGESFVVGSRVTYWIAEGMVGTETIGAWGVGQVSPKRLPAIRNGTFPWQASPVQGALAVIDGVARATARHRHAEDGRTHALQQLHTYERHHSLIYSTGESEIYLHDVMYRTVNATRDQVS